jgi:hypothetical protein
MLKLTFKTSVVIESAAALIQVEITAIDNSIVELHASRLG